MLSLSTVFLPVAPLFVKYLTRTDLEETGAFFLSSDYAADKMTTFAAIVGVKVREFDLTNEDDVNEIRWLMMRVERDE